MSVLKVRPYRVKTAFRYLAGTIALDKANTPVKLSLPFKSVCF